MPAVMGKAKAKARLIENLADEFQKVAQASGVPIQDFPDVRSYQKLLESYDLCALPKASKATLATYEEVIDRDLPGIMGHFASGKRDSTGAPAGAAVSDFKGWLMKQSTKGAWQKRYFILRDGQLEYYRKPEEPKPSGALDLAACRAAPHPESNRDFCIRLETSERPYHLAAADGDDMSAWLLALQSNCQGRFDDDGAKGTFK